MNKQLLKELSNDIDEILNLDLKWESKRFSSLKEEIGDYVLYFNSKSMDLFVSQWVLGDYCRNCLVHHNYLKCLWSQSGSIASGCDFLVKITKDEFETVKKFPKIYMEDAIKKNTS